MKMMFIMVVILIVLLSASLAFNVVFYKKAFIPLQSLRLDPFELGRYPAESDPVVRDKPLLMFYGDSRALAWFYFDSDKFTLINRSIGGQSTSQIVGRFQQHVALNSPRLMIIQMGVNDLKTIPLFPERKKTIIQSCKDNIKKTISMAHAMHSKVVVTTIFPLGDVSIARKVLGIREQPIIEAIDEVNRFIQSLETENTVVFDSFQLLVDEDQKINPKYSHDWLHLNQQGYQHMNSRLHGLIDQLSIDF